MLGLLGLRIFEAIGADIGDLGEEPGHRVLRVCGKRWQGRAGSRCPPNGASFRLTESGGRAEVTGPARLPSMSGSAERAVGLRV